MAFEELNCTDNFSIPRGPRGPKGDTGVEGIQGPAGIAQTGPQGNAGGSKLEIAIRESNNPFVTINSKVYKDVSYFIFPGTSVFIPTIWKIAVSIVDPNKTGTTMITRIGKISNGTKEVISTISMSAGIDPTIHRFSVLQSNLSLTSLPADGSVFFIESVLTSRGSISSVEGRIYALELR